MSEDYKSILLKQLKQLNPYMSKHATTQDQRMYDLIAFSYAHFEQLYKLLDKQESELELLKRALLSSNVSHS